MVEYASTCAQDRPVVDRVSDAEPRLEGVVVCLREAFRLIAEQRQHRWIACDGQARAIAFEAGAGQYDPVVPIAPDDASGCPIDDWGGRLVVELRFEVCDVIGLGMPWRPDGPAQTAFDRQIACRLPGILHEDIRCERAPLGERTLANFTVVAEQAQRDIRHGKTGTASAIVLKLEPPILIVRTTRDRLHVDLIEIV